MKLLNLALMIVFKEKIGLNPNFYLFIFLTCCAANKIPKDDYLGTFTTTLQRNAFAWYQKQNHALFVDWPTLKKDASLIHF